MQILVQGFLRERGSNFPLFLWLVLLSLKHYCTTVPACDKLHFFTFECLNMVVVVLWLQKAVMVQCKQAHMNHTQLKTWMYTRYETGQMSVFYCAACNADAVLWWEFCLSIRPSVRLSVTRMDCDKTVERFVQSYIPYERTFSLVFWEEEWLVGRPLLPANFGSTDRR